MSCNLDGSPARAKEDGGSGQGRDGVWGNKVTKDVDVHKENFIVRDYRKREIEVKGHKRKLKHYFEGTGS